MREIYLGIKCFFYIRGIFKILVKRKHEKTHTAEMILLSPPKQWKLPNCLYLPSVLYRALPLLRSQFKNGNVAHLT